ncbi:MAG: glycosyltransferase family 2 protein [Rikenellaceae bacterium]|nr:glycosyltransferase family 2 protein [Rikenellaceae bacterium]
MPQVSIITPTYNCARFIEETIKSVQAQTFTDWEMIISDDCSTDNTKEVIAPYLASDSRIKYICNDKNSGAAITRNNALRIASGRWIAFLDSDDLWLPEKLEKQISFMETNDYAFTYHEYSEISEDGEDLGVTVSGIKKVGKFGMYACCWPGCLSVMYDQKKIGVIQINDIRKNNDTAMWLKVIKKSNCYLLKETLAKYRRRKGSITPPSIKDRILWHYRLFRDAEEMNKVSAFIWMIINIIGNSYKKVFYISRK